MSYTSPNGQPQGYANSSVNKVREALMSEVIAINGYAEHIANSNMQVVNDVWKRIMQDEKDHFGMFLELIRKYDPVEYQQYQIHMRENVTVTPVQSYNPSYDKQLILNNIRSDIKGELEAIVLYEQHQDEIPHQDIKDTFEKVMNDEKSHTEHLTNLLLKYDPDKYNNLK